MAAKVVIEFSTVSMKSVPAALKERILTEVERGEMVTSGGRLLYINNVSDFIKFLVKDYFHEQDERKNKR